MELQTNYCSGSPAAACVDCCAQQPVELTPVSGDNGNCDNGNNGYNGVAALFDGDTSCTTYTSASYCFSSASQYYCTGLRYVQLDYGQEAHIAGVRKWMYHCIHAPPTTAEPACVARRHLVDAGVVVTHRHRSAASGRRGRWHHG